LGSLGSLLLRVPIKWTYVADSVKPFDTQLIEIVRACVHDIERGDRDGASPLSLPCTHEPTRISSVNWKEIKRSVGGYAQES
jgi:hypothetical protein